VKAVKLFNTVIPDFNTVIPAQAGIQLIERIPRSGSTSGFVCCAELLNDWIPACAGMTNRLSFEVH
jgi:hypothetical protein